MSDTYTLSFRNFRSLEDVTLEVAPLTVVYGPNGSGKSSLIYGLLTLKNFLTNPNLNIPSLFAYPSITLGGLHEVVHRHLPEKEISLSFSVSNSQELSPRFTLTLHESGGAIDLSFEDSGLRRDWRINHWPSSLRMEIAVPYQANQQVEERFVVHARPAPQPQSDYDVPSAMGTLLGTGRCLVPA